MKIDESCVNHNAIMLIEELTESIYELCGDGDMNDIRLVTLGHIRGIIEMAKAMKEVLKA